MKSIKVLEWISDGTSRENPRVTKCFNVGTDKRLYLSKASDFLRQYRLVTPSPFRHGVSRTVGARRGKVLTI